MTQKIHPASGYILVEQYVPKNQTFKSVKETEGEDQASVVLEVGGSILDSGGITREAGVKVGEVIIHAETNKIYTHNHKMLRFVHFTEVHGVLDGSSI